MSDVRVRAENKTQRSGTKIDYGPYVGVVVNNADSLYSGRLQVWIPSFGGNSTEKTSWHTVSYANPFYGITPYKATDSITKATSASTFRAGESNPLTAGYLDNTKRRKETRSFGMWTQPPEIGTRVLVVFADGHPDKGFWIAAIPEVAHGMIPALGKGRSGQVEAEFDPSDSTVQTATDIRTVQRPTLPDVTASYDQQGTLKDPMRGLLTTSSFRESPSRVMGFSTPEGHSFVMDDGTAPDNNGQSTSKLIRMRTKGGNQITLNDDTGMLYFINANGNAWMELSGDGQVHVYGENGINFATKKDINLHADGNINMHSNQATKVVAGTGLKLQGTKELQLHGAKTMIEGVDSIEMHSCGELNITSFKDVFIKGFNFLVAQAKCFRWNSGTALEAEQVPPEKPSKVSGYQTTVAVAPSHEPYDQHFNGSAQQGQQAALNQGQQTPEQAAAAANDARVAQSNAVGGGGPSPSGGSFGFAIGNEPGNPFGGSNANGTGRGTSSGNPGSSLQSYISSVGRQNVATTATSLAQNATKYAPVPMPIPRPADLGVTQPTRPGQNISGVTPGPMLGGNVDGPAPTVAQPPSTSLTQTPSANQLRPDVTNNTGTNAVNDSTTPTSEASSSYPAGPNAGANAGGMQTGKPAYQGGPNAGSNAGPTMTGGTNSDGTPANPAVASSQLSGFGPATSIPAAPGGGSTSGFAKGDNCARPTGTGAGQGGTAGPYAPGGKADPVKEQEMYDYLTKEKGLSHEQAVGMIANMRAESGYKSDAVGDNGNSIGLFQYNGPAGRAGPFEAAVPDWRTNWKGQIDYALTQDPVGKQFAATSFASATDASNFWVQKFEIPADMPGQMGVRAANAQQIESTLNRGR